MKILVFHPKMEQIQDQVSQLERDGFYALTCETPEDAECIYEFHRNSLDLLIVHREGLDSHQDSGFQFLKALAQSKPQNDVPVIVTTEVWSEKECAAHQKSSLGAAAYLKSPWEASQLSRLMHQVLGIQANQNNENHPALEIALPQAVEPNFGVVLSSPDTMKEEASGSIQLEAPEIFPLERVEESQGSMLEDPEPVPPAAPVVEEAVEFSIPHESPVEEQGGLELGPVSFSEVHEAQEVQEAQEAEKPTDPKVEKEYPYLFPKNVDSSAIVHSYIHEAILPGGVSEQATEEDWKKALALREQDVAVLSSQIQKLKDRNQELEEAQKMMDIQLREIHGEKQQEVDQTILQVEQLQSKHRDLERQLTEKFFILEEKESMLRSLQAEKEKHEREWISLQKRVREDFRKLSIRERDLEAQLEILKHEKKIEVELREAKMNEAMRKFEMIQIQLEIATEKNKMIQREKENLETKLRQTKEKILSWGTEISSVSSENDLVKKVS